MKFFRIVSFFSLSFLLLNVGLQAQTDAPANPTLRLQPVFTGLSNPVFVTNAKDGSKRLFVVQKGGIIKVAQAGANTTTDFMNITTRVFSTGSEQGLLGLTFHPNFATNGYFFVNYTRQTDAATVIARFKTTDSTNTLGDPASERILLTIPQPFSNHNGGMIEFGPDGHLYIGTGDGGSANDPGNRSQNINELLGKMLRITPDVSGNTTTPAYTNPADNPFIGIDGADEVYATGLRNPWRWSFDRAGTRQLYAGDVGQNAIEEIDIVTRGGNYGWRVYEGNTCTGLGPATCTPANYIAPIAVYDHSGGKCSITGGYVYRGRKDRFPSGAYFYADYCSGEIFMLNNGQSTMLLDTPNLLSSFGEDEDGEVYVITYNSTTGTVQRLVSAKSNADFDGDLKTDFSVFRPSNTTWYISNSLNGAARTQQFGVASTDDLVPDDYDGDGKTDIAVFRNGTWYVLRSSDSAFRTFQWGTTGDKPVVGDYDGDGKADYAVFRNNGIWYVNRSSDGGFTGVQWGLGTDTLVPGNYDGDGRTDFAVFRAGVWYILQSSNGAFTGYQWGTTGDFVAPADYDGDFRTDIAVVRNGIWYILQSTAGSRTVQWGTPTDIPAVGDYNGDSRADIAVFRDGNWFALRSDNVAQTFQYGSTGDKPVPTADIP